MERSSIRAAAFVLAAAFGTILTACSGGGSSTIPQSTLRQQPAPGTSAGTTESLINDRFTPSAHPAYTFKTFNYHVMPVHGATAAARTRTPATTIYPMDLTYFGGPVVSNPTIHNVYVDCPTGPHCWGTPGNFLLALGHSRMAQVARQYTGAQVAMTLGTGVNLGVPFYSSTVYENDLLAYLHRAATRVGATGFNHIYNLFLPPGIDTCFDQTTQCYSPDNPSNFAFCGYHTAVQYSDIGVVVFTVEPFQGVPGCNYLNENDLPSATANVLSHETFETITDEVPGYGWVNVNGFGEIGDECAWSTLTDETFGSNGTYDIQLEYSNQLHACSDQASSLPPPT